MEIKIAVPATSANLGPGFDTLGVALKLYNYLEIDPDTDTLAFEISGEGSAVLPRVPPIWCTRLWLLFIKKWDSCRRL